MRRMRNILPCSFFQPLASYAQRCHLACFRFTELSQTQLRKFNYLENVGQHAGKNVALWDFTSRVLQSGDLSWYDIDLLKRLIEGDPHDSRSPLSVDDAFAQLDTFKKLLTNALNEAQLYLLNELYEYGLRREHLDLAKITPVDVLNGQVNFHAVRDVLDMLGSDPDAYGYRFKPEEWLRFFVQAFRHHVQRNVTGEDPLNSYSDYNKFFRTISCNPALLEESVKKTLSDMVSLDSVGLVLMAYGLGREEVNSIERNRDSYRAANERLWSKRHALDSGLAASGLQKK